ncbi:hypothetical protein HKD37_18G050680 [Glycine soja]
MFVFDRLRDIQCVLRDFRNASVIHTLVYFFKSDLFIEEIVFRDNLVDLALKVLRENPRQALARNENQETGLHVLARKRVTTTGGGFSEKLSTKDGPALNASFSNDFDLAFIPGLCALLVSDHMHRLVRQINLKEEDCTLVLNLTERYQSLPLHRDMEALPNQSGEASYRCCSSAPKAQLLAAVAPLFTQS